MKKLILMTMLFFSNITVTANAMPGASEFCQEERVEKLSAEEARGRSLWTAKCLPELGGEIWASGKVVDRIAGYPYFVNYPILGHKNADGKIEAIWMAPTSPDRDCSDLRSDEVVAVCPTDRGALELYERDHPSQKEARILIQLLKPVQVLVR